MLQNSLQFIGGIVMNNHVALAGGLVADPHSRSELVRQVLFQRADIGILFGLWLFGSGILLLGVLGFVNYSKHTKN